MKNQIINIGLMFLLFGTLSMVFTACDDNIDPLITELDFDRELSPIGLEGAIRNQIEIELDWKVDNDVDHYVVEFSEDSLEFNSIIRTLTVMPNELPVTESFFGNTRYSARVKAISTDGKDDSKWSAITLRTSPENIMLPFVPSDDAGITEVTVKWPAGQQATRFVITPGDIERAITAGEVANGEATITGLDYYTVYNIKMLAGNSQRGNLNAKTLMDPDCPTCIKLNPGGDISAAVDAAPDGAILVLSSGVYPEQGSIDVAKSVTLRGALYYDRPEVYGQITSAATVASIEVSDIHFRGDAASSLGQFFNSISGLNLTNLTIEGCEISRYNNGLIYNNVSGIFGTITVSNSYIHTMAGSGGDGIDFRSGTIGSLNVINSTFANGFRSFLRMQVACAVSFSNSTFYAISIIDNSNNNGIFRMNKSAGGSFEVKNSLFVETGVMAPNTAQAGNFCRQDSYMVDSPTYLNNNIYNCHNIFVGIYTTPSSVSATELDPGFVDAANGDFTVTNLNLKDRKVGDPRWLQ